MDDLIFKLQSDDPAQRRAAIIALGKSQDPAALGPLSTAYRTDPDPALRELALNAGRYIRHHMAAAGTRPSAPPFRADAPLTGSPTPEPEPKTAFARDKERARGYLDAAIGQHTSGQRARALDSLGKALSIDPALAQEPFVANLIITLTNLPTQEAVRILTNAQQRAAFIERMDRPEPGHSKRQSKIKTPENDATWPNVLIDFALYGLVSVLGVLAIFLFAMPLIEDVLNEAMAANTPGAEFTFTDIQDFTQASLAILLPSALGAGAYAVIGILIQGAAIHIAATFFLSGDGTLVHLYHRLVPFSTAISILWALSFVVFSLVGSFDDFQVYSLIAVPVSLVISYWMASLVGKVYRFGAFTGCLSIILGGVVLAAFFGCGGCLFGNLLGALGG